MCGRRLKIFFLLLMLFSALPCLPSLSSCYADVTLTDEEAQEMLNEITESKKDLQELQIQLEDVKNDCNEQKIYYEEQLSEANKKNKVLKGTSIAGGSTSAVLLIVIIFITCI